MTIIGVFSVSLIAVVKIYNRGLKGSAVIMTFFQWVFAYSSTGVLLPKIKGSSW